MTNDTQTQSVTNMEPWNSNQTASDDGAAVDTTHEFLNCIFTTPLLQRTATTDRVEMRVSDVYITGEEYHFLKLRVGGWKGGKRELFHTEAHYYKTPELTAAHIGRRSYHQIQSHNFAAKYLAERADSASEGKCHRHS